MLLLLDIRVSVEIIKLSGSYSIKKVRELEERSENFKNIEIGKYRKFENAKFCKVREFETFGNLKSLLDIRLSVEEIKLIGGP